jgi:hypothetical protein
MTVEERRAFVARRNPEKTRERDRKRSTDPERKKHIAANTKRWRQANPQKAAAQRKVAYEVSKGRLTAGPCEKANGDCLGRIHAHHDDYSKPLDVMWLCALHHKARHAELREQGR